MTTVGEVVGAAVATYVVLVGRLLAEAATQHQMTTQMMMGTTTKSTNAAIDTPTASHTTFTERETNTL